MISTRLQPSPPLQFYAYTTAYHPYKQLGPQLPPIDFRRAFRPIPMENQQKRKASPADPGVAPPVKKQEKEIDLDELAQLARRAMPQDGNIQFPINFSWPNGQRPDGLDPALSSVRSTEDIPVIPPEIRFEDTLNTSTDSPNDTQDGNHLGVDDDDRPKSGQPFSRSPELRVTHKLAERKRRKEMKELFDELREHLPPERGIKSSKWEILSKSIDYVTYLKKQNVEAAQEVDRLRRELDIARGGTGTYTPYTYSFTTSYPGPGTYAAAPQQATSQTQVPAPTLAQPTAVSDQIQTQPQA